MNKVDNFVKETNYDLEILKLRYDTGSSFIYIYLDDLTLGFINVANNKLMNVNIPQSKLTQLILKDINKITCELGDLCWICM